RVLRSVFVWVPLTSIQHFHCFAFIVFTFRVSCAASAVDVLIYASSTFAQDGVGGLRGGYEYAPTGSPTQAPLEPRWRRQSRRVLSRRHSSSRDGRDRLRPAGELRPGDHVVIPDDAYGGEFD
ncbi:hypothetical protein ABLN72_00965, partial [Mycobacterium tuberculosis]